MADEYILDFEKNLLSGERILWTGETAKKLFVSCRAYAITNMRILKMKKNGRIKPVELQYVKDIWLAGGKKKYVAYYWEKSRVTENGINVNSNVTSGLFGLKDPESVFKILDSAMYNLNNQKERI